MTTSFACGGDDSDDTGGETSPTTESPSTDPSSGTDPTIDPSSGTNPSDPSSSTDPTDASSSTDPTDATSTDTTAGPVDTSGTETGGNELCAEYCTGFIANCQGRPNVVDYADEGACLTACEGFDASGMDGDFDGATLQCRISHLNGGNDDGWYDTHCEHAQEVPTSNCV